MIDTFSTFKVHAHPDTPLPDGFTRGAHYSNPFGDVGYHVHGETLGGRVVVVIEAPNLRTGAAGAAILATDLGSIADGLLDIPF